LKYLTAERDRGVRVVGSEIPYSFVFDGENGEPAMKSKAVVEKFDKQGNVSETETANQE
jgi:hypothetical protein